MESRWIVLFVLAGILAFSIPVYADTFGGIPGRDYGDYSSYNTHSYDDWPSEYRDLCDQHMRAVIKRCAVDAKTKGYDNWFVSRMRGSTQVLPARSGYSNQDVIIGTNNCAYNENADDETYISSAVLSFMCSENEKGSVTGSDQYTCSFTCAAWDCEDDVDLYSVSACIATEENVSANPFTKMTLGCQKQTAELCAARGAGCALEQPCYYYDYDRKLVHCDCSCSNTLDSPTLTEAELSLATSEPFNLDTFNWDTWKQQNPGPCDPVRSTVEEKGFFDKVKSALTTIKDTGGHVVGFVTDGVKSMLDKSTLPFSKIGGVLGASKNGQVIVVTPGVNISSTTGITPTSDLVSSLIAGANAALPYLAAEKTFNLLGPPESNQEVAEANQSACPLPDCGLWGACTNNLQTRLCKSTPANCPKPETRQSCAPCQESWSCGEYGDWSDWSVCTSSSTQTRTQERLCTDDNACGTETTRPIETETQSQSCTYTPPSNCTESWSCDEWGGWSDWSECQPDSTQTRMRTRPCTDANACGTTVNRPSTTENESQSCTYTPPANYHEKQAYLDMISGGATTISAGLTYNWNLTTGESIVYVFSLADATSLYESFVQVTSGAGLGYVLQQRYGPPQLTYTDTTPGTTQFNGGPTMTGSDVQRVAIKVGPATATSGGTLIVNTS
ncbi:MAG: hypothetical protein Q8P05_03940 [Candidatus Diapherotrites archaeon]|nr:hypothetical protein [Candidatus Diapherotrites archaeon]